MYAAPDAHVEYDDYGIPVFSAAYFKDPNDKRIYHVKESNMPSEIWEGELAISKSSPIRINPSGPVRCIYLNGKYMG